ncbi:right-handed parallel beta-helix repeat-containing protein, partial [Candidatus Parcubacteria bacterium]|nr:right-handed parallel beta-helix repeat-containing protein [Candidatus Parcubacteria bacterium]
IDLVDCSEKWFAGKASPDYISMERIDSALDGSDSENWASNNLITRNGLDADGNLIFGTPKSENSVSKLQTEISNNLPFSDEIPEITLTKLGAPYIIRWMLSVPQGKTLVIEPGVVLKFRDRYSGISVSGTLKAIGNETENEKIIFTSNNSSPQPGDWKEIYFTASSVESELNNVIIRYAGGYQLSDSACPGQAAAIRVDQSAIILKNSIIENNKRQGLYLVASSSIIDNVQFLENPPCEKYGKKYGGIGILIDGNSPTIKNSVFEKNTIGIKITNSASPQIENNVFEDNKKPIYVYESYPSFNNNQAINNDLNGILVYGGNISQNTTWRADLPYIVDGMLGVSQNVILTLEAGVIIKFRNGHSGMNISGTLKAIGADGKKIIFTSYKDADYNGSGSAAAGDWKQIYFSPTSVNSELSNVVIKYGGKWSTSDNSCHPDRAAVRVEASSIILKNSFIEENKNRGVYLINSSATINNVNFSNHQSICEYWWGDWDAIALLIDGNSPTIKNSTFKNNYYGIYIQSGSPIIEKNNHFGENDEKNNINIYSVF